jgi:hypothetical protein
MTVARLIVLGMVGAAFWLLGALIVVTVVHADSSTVGIKCQLLDDWAQVTAENRDSGIPLTQELQLLNKHRSTLDRDTYSMLHAIVVTIYANPVGSPRDAHDAALAACAGSATDGTGQ